MSTAERIASEFHSTYEALAPSYGYETREASAVEWEDVPEANKRLMVAVVQDLLSRDVIIASTQGGIVPLGREEVATPEARDHTPTYGEGGLEELKAHDAPNQNIAKKDGIAQGGVDDAAAK